MAHAPPRVSYASIFKMRTHGIPQRPDAAQALTTAAAVAVATKQKQWRAVLNAVWPVEESALATDSNIGLHCEQRPAAIRRHRKTGEFASVGPSSVLSAHGIHIIRPPVFGINRLGWPKPFQEFS